ncbi:MAG: hypothetical protein LBV68_03110 [Spirochaetaceae bacterium]|jgi:hypothetical protein|nr:hypothetical protein [Spirochaetaceae bacterium]
MKKNTLILSGILGLMLVFVFGACDTGSSGNTDPKVIRITGITSDDTAGAVLVSLSIFDNLQNAQDPTKHTAIAVPVAVGTITDGSVTFALTVQSGGNPSAQPWTGNGEYYIGLGTLNGGAQPPYTQVNNWAYGTGVVPSKYNIDAGLKTISLAEFRKQ